MSPVPHGLGIFQVAKAVYAPNLYISSYLKGARKRQTFPGDFEESAVNSQGRIGHRARREESDHPIHTHPHIPHEIFNADGESDT